MSNATWALLVGMLLFPGALFSADPIPAVNGIFLAAKPNFTDPNFTKTVVLVTQHKHGGPVGVIINRPSATNLSELFKIEGDTSDPGKLYLGGPVSPSALVVVFRKTASIKEALHVLPEVQMSNNSALLEELLKLPDAAKNVRVYAGFAAWAPGQLENEIARGDWYVLKADEEAIFDKDPATIWGEMVKRATSRAI